jgi:DNA-binding ferritin-like protein
MPNEASVDLVGYLMGDAPVAGAIEETPVVTVIADPVPPPPVAEAVMGAPNPVADDDMLDLMALMKRIGMAAKNLHYRAKGKPFYGLHLLSDLVVQVEHDTDEIAEIYYLGERGIEPPKMEEVCLKAATLPLTGDEGDKYYISALLHITLETMHKVENIKKKYSELKSGVVAVLDHVSQQCLLSIGLLDQTMKG